MPPRCSKLSAPLETRRAVRKRTEKKAAPKPSGLLDALLRRRVVFVAGKGGTGRTTVSAALALLAMKAGKRVLAVDAEAKGDLATALGSHPIGFAPHVVQRNLSALSIDPEESLREYLRIFFKVPRVAQLGPFAGMLDFIATGVPGLRDLLIVGKIAYEERRREPNGRPVWDLIVVDSAASGHVVSHLAAPRAMLTLVRGGLIRGQVEWVDALVRDSGRSTVLLCALPEEMPVVEAAELYARLQTVAGVSVTACVLNRAVTVSVSAPERRVAMKLSSGDHLESVTERLGGSPGAIAVSAALAQQLHERTAQYERLLRSKLPVPVVTLPLQATRTGLTTTRALADDLAEVLA
jgi:anion-transporting  ArsA/GET3 family ATPase